MEPAFCCTVVTSGVRQARDKIAAATGNTRLDTYVADFASLREVHRPYPAAQHRVGHYHHTCGSEVVNTPPGAPPLYLCEQGE